MRNQNVTLRVLNYFDQYSSGSNAETEQLWNAFTKANPNVTIEREDVLGDYYYYQQITAAIADSNLPDVLYVLPSENAAQMYENHLLKDLSSLVANDKHFVASFDAKALDSVAHAGGYLSYIPLSFTASHVFYVNTAVLSDAGLKPATSYAELNQQVPLLKAKGYDTVLMANQDSWVMQHCLFSLIAGRFAGKGWDARVLSGRSKFTDPDLMDALRFVQSLYDDGVLSETTLNTSYGSVGDLFLQNKAAYFIDNASRASSFIPSGAEDRIKLGVFPDVEAARLKKSSSAVIGG
jgi:raffinose/stachyose/melibiose transport system substrate-binding protein